MRSFMKPGPGMAIAQVDIGKALPQPFPAIPC